MSVNLEEAQRGTVRNIRERGDPASKEMKTEMS